MINFFIIILLNMRIMALFIFRWDFIKIGNKTLKDMDRMIAFEKALTTWGHWVDANINTSKSMVFFQGISPSHYK